MTEPIQISEEARTCANAELMHWYSATTIEEGKSEIGMHVQLLLNSRDAELREARSKCICAFCKQEFPKSNIDEVAKHLIECSASPLVQGIKSAKEGLDAADKAIEANEEVIKLQGAELRELRKDKERLDWIAGNFSNVRLRSQNRFGQIIKKFDWLHTYPEALETLREALDSAMSGKKSGK